MLTLLIISVVSYCELKPCFTGTNTTNTCFDTDLGSRQQVGSETNEGVQPFTAHVGGAYQRGASLPKRERRSP